MLIEILGVLFSLLYIFLEIRQDKIMWIVGFISSAFYVYIFFHAKFYADMGLNAYYVLASVYGWILWSRKKEVRDKRLEMRDEKQVTGDELRVTGEKVPQPTVIARKPEADEANCSSLITVIARNEANSSLIAKLLLTTVLLFAALAYILRTYTDSPVPLGDALTTALSIVATWMLAHKILEQWWIWVFVNTLSMSLYIWRGLYPTAFLFLCYTIASIIGYYRWKKSMQAY